MPGASPTALTPEFLPRSVTSDPRARVATTLTQVEELITRNLGEVMDAMDADRRFIHFRGTHGERRRAKLSKSVFSTRASRQLGSTSLNSVRRVKLTRNFVRWRHTLAERVKEVVN